MKPFSIFGLLCCLLGFALATPSQAEEHYIYRNAAGNLVISNKPPRAGSEVLRKLDLPEVDGARPQQSKEGDDIRPKRDAGER